MESRIQILDRLAHKWSRNNTDCIAVNTFEEWLNEYAYNSEATIRLVHIAMQEYAKPIKNNDFLNSVSTRVCYNCKHRCKNTTAKYEFEKHYCLKDTHYITNVSKHSCVDFEHGC